MIAATAATIMIVLHAVDGRELDINPSQVTSMREASAPDTPVVDKRFAANVRCMVSLADGKFITVVEECATIRAMLHDVGVEK
jgi:hypothetical protein